MAISDLLKSCPIFFDLYDNEIEKVVKKCKVFCFPKDEIIANEGDEAGEILILLEGEVIALKKDQKGNSNQLDLYSRGAVFGYVVLVEENTYSNAFIAKSEAHVLKIPFKQLLNVFDADPRVFGIICLNLSRILAKRLEKLKRSVHDDIISLKEIQSNLSELQTSSNTIISSDHKEVGKNRK